MSNENGTLKTKRNATMSMDTVRELTEYMRDQGVHQFSFGELSVTFDPHHQLQKQPLIGTIDDEEAKQEELRELLRERLDETHADLTWST